MTWLERDDADAYARKELWRAEGIVRARVCAIKDAQRYLVDADFRARIAQARRDFDGFGISREVLLTRRADAEIVASAHGSFVGFEVDARNDTDAAAGVIASLDWLPPHVGYRPRTTREKR